MISLLFGVALAFSQHASGCKVDADCELKLEPKCKMVVAVSKGQEAVPYAGSTCRVFEQPQILVRYNAKCVEKICQAVYKP